MKKMRFLVYALVAVVFLGACSTKTQKTNPTQGDLGEKESMYSNILGTWRVDTIINSNEDPDIKLEIYDDWILLHNDSCANRKQSIPIINGKRSEPSKSQITGYGKWTVKNDTVIMKFPLENDPKHQAVVKLLITDDGLIASGNGQKLIKVD